MNIRDLLPHISEPRAIALEREVRGEIAADVATRKAEILHTEGFAARWRTRSRERLSREPAHAEWNALRRSLDAVDEAVGEGREFSWACSDRERVAVLDRCVIKAAGGLV